MLLAVFAGEKPTAGHAIEVARVERDFGYPAAALPLLRAAADLASGAGLSPLATAAASLLARLVA
jgi:hypothetical protein